MAALVQGSDKKSKFQDRGIKTWMRVKKKLIAIGLLTEDEGFLMIALVMDDGQLYPDCTLFSKK